MAIADKSIQDFTSGCPMTIELCSTNKITAKQQKAFCNLGCSVDCKKQLTEYLERRNK